jgi:DNA replication protein DnaC
LNSLTPFARRWARADVLVLDDWGLAQVGGQERRDLLEILEGRDGRHSTVVTSQLPVTSWYDSIGDPTLADGILDRLVHGAYQIAMEGESMRRQQATRSRSAPEDESSPQ